MEILRRWLRRPSRAANSRSTSGCRVLPDSPTESGRRIVRARVVGGRDDGGGCSRGKEGLQQELQIYIYIGTQLHTYRGQGGG